MNRKGTVAILLVAGLSIAVSLTACGSSGGGGPSPPSAPGMTRVYTVSFLANDGHGESCTGRVQICVLHDQRPGATCVDDGAAFESTT